MCDIILQWFTAHRGHQTNRKCYSYLWVVCIHPYCGWSYGEMYVRFQWLGASISSSCSNCLIQANICTEWHKENKYVYKIKPCVEVAHSTIAEPFSLHSSLCIWNELEKSEANPELDSCQGRSLPALRRSFSKLTNDLKVFDPRFRPQSESVLTPADLYSWADHTELANTHAIPAIDPRGPPLSRSADADSTLNG